MIFALNYQSADWTEAKNVIKQVTIYNENKIYNVLWLIASKRDKQKVQCGAQYILNISKEK